MAASKNVIEQTWLAYAFDHPAGRGRIEAGLERVGSHYTGQLADPPPVSADVGELHGLALWAPLDPRLRWPLWASEGGLSIAASAVPTGWERVTGPLEPRRAAVHLARALMSAPERLGELNPPFVIGIRDRDAASLTIVSDALGAGRLYEMRTPEGVVWSNRLGALPLFAGVRPRADPRGWRLFAAAGWFPGEATPIEGAIKVRPGQAIVVRARGTSSEVERRESGARRALVEPRRSKLSAGVDAAAGQIEDLARGLGRAWSEPIAISLTGGRDSRVSAAGALAAGLDATFNTGDQVPGELDVVRRLIETAPREMAHEVRKPDSDSDGAGELPDRVKAIHLVHDGMRNPQELRRNTELPVVEPPPPTLSGHGGEIGHGFYYTTRRKLRQIRRAGAEGPLEQLERSARRRHSAASEESYATYVEECERSLEEGRAYGVAGPDLLDWFYLAQRLPYRSGLAARSARYSACVTPAFVRAAFDLKPKQRLRAKLHREVIGRLVPEWRKLSFFSSDAVRMPEIHRERIWERPGDAATIEEMLAAGGGWTDELRPDRVREMWREVRREQGSADYEHVFYRLVWRSGFDTHLDLLGDRATGL